MPTKPNRNFKPFKFFTNTGGQDEKTGELANQPNFAKNITNLHVDALGQWTAFNQGYSNFSSQLESGARVDGIAWYVDASSVSHLLLACNGKIKTVNLGSGATANISSAFTAGKSVSFATFKGTVYACADGTAPQKWTASGSMSSASGFPSTNGSETYNQPKIVCNFLNRLAYANFTSGGGFPSHVVLSDNLNGESFTYGVLDSNAIAFQAKPGDGQQVTCLRSYGVPNSQTELLFIFKDRSFYVLTGTTPATFDLTCINSTVGCVNNNSAVQIGTDFFFTGHDDIYSVTTANLSGSLQPLASNVELVKQTISTINQNALDKCFAIHLPLRREAWFGIPTGSSTEVDTVLVYYYNTDPTTGQPIKSWSVMTGLNASCAVLVANQLYTGNSTGYIGQWFNSDLYGGTAFTYNYKYPFYDFGSQAQIKYIPECYLWFIVNEACTLNFTSTWRSGGNNITKTIPITVPLPGGSSLYDTAVYDTGLYTGVGLLAKVRVPVLGNGEAVQFSISGSTSSGAPTFCGISGLVEYGSYSRSYK